ncbi:MAG: LysR substrate-binding domain-containing protein [Roseobacter sp.]
MLPPRRFLPSISALVAFEAIARTGSATDAARELNLTQGAVSRQLKALEAQLDTPLCAREGRQLRLTPAGETYAEQIRALLQKLAKATVDLKTRPIAGALNLAILPAFGMHWLAPRLRDFAMLHPEVTVNLSTRLAPFDFQTAPFDAAIHFGRDDWPGAASLPLLPEIVVPVCAPGFIAPGGHDDRMLLSVDLLHLDTRPRGWQRWFRAVGIDHPLPRGMVFDQFATMAQAAIHGLGVALLPTFAAQPYLSRGELVLASERTSESIGTYYLVWPQDRAETAPLLAFRDWLRDEVAQDTGAGGGVA